MVELRSCEGGRRGGFADQEEESSKGEGRGSQTRGNGELSSLEEICTLEWRDGMG